MDHWRPQVIVYCDVIEARVLKTASDVKRELEFCRKDVKHGLLKGIVRIATFVQSLNFAMLMLNEVLGQWIHENFDKLFPHAFFKWFGCLAIPSRSKYYWWAVTATSTFATVRYDRFAKNWRLRQKKSEKWRPAIKIELFRIRNH